MRLGESDGKWHLDSHDMHLPLAKRIPPFIQSVRNLPLTPAFLRIFPSMKALVIDDEAKAREVLGLLIRYHIPEITEIVQADGGAAATEVLTAYSPDLVFLDIKMPGQDGFDWLKSLNKRDFDVIFTTAYDQYAIKAIRFAAFDYLLKPVDAEDLRSTIDRYLISQNSAKLTFDNLFYNTTQHDPRDFRLTIATTEQTSYLDPVEIVRCEADGNYTHFYLADGKHIMASRSLGLYHDLLGDLGFIRCHKSHLVNKRFVESISEKILMLSNGHRVEVSRRRMPLVREAMG